MRPDAAAHLWDAREACARTIRFVADVEETQYRANDLLRSAVERQLEIIGEALNNVRRVDPEIANRIPELHRIIGLRNVLAHGYATVDDAVVWSAASRRAPELILILDGLLDEVAQSG